MGTDWIGNVNPYAGAGRRLSFSPRLESSDATPGVAVCEIQGLDKDLEYEVCVTWRSADGRASDATYSVFNGHDEEALITKDVDQRVAPPGQRPGFAFAGRTWLPLGKVTAARGVLASSCPRRPRGVWRRTPSCCGHKHGPTSSG